MNENYFKIACSVSSSVLHEIEYSYSVAVTRRMNKFIIDCDSVHWSGRNRRASYVRLAAPVLLIDDGSHNVSRETAAPVVK